MTTSGADPEKWPRRVVYGVWWFLFAAALGFVLRFGRNQPWLDEWDFIPVLVGGEPWLPWLWEQHNEHRFPWPRLLFLPCFFLTNDFRTGMILQVVGCAWLARVLIGTAARLRGSTAYADALFPLALLHWGHYENFLMGYQLVFFWHLAQAVGLIVIVLNLTAANRFRIGLLSSVTVLGLSLSGVAGMVYVPLFCIWSGCLAGAELRSGSERARTRAGALIVAGLLPVGVLPLHYIGWQAPSHHPPSAGIWPSVQIAAQALSMVCGELPELCWPIGSLIVVAFFLTTAGLLLTRLCEPTSPRLLVLGLLLHLLAVAIIMGGIGWGRSGFEAERGIYRMGFWSRYAFLGLPGLFAAVFAWLRFGGSYGRRWVPRGLMIVFGLLLPVNLGFGLVRGEQRACWTDENLARIECGEPAWKISWERGIVGTRDYETPTRGIEILRRERFGRYAAAGTPAAVEERAVPIVFWWVVGGLLLIPFRRRGRDWLTELHLERVRESFLLQQERLEEIFLEAARKSGRPRGLLWSNLTSEGPPIFAREESSGRVFVLLAVQIEFQAVPGGPMEDVQAVGEPKSGTAVFRFENGEFHTEGRVIFNLGPIDALQQMGNRFTRVDFVTEAKA